MSHTRYGRVYASRENTNAPPAIGGPVRVEKDITKNKNPSREPMSSGGDICAVHAGNNPMTTPKTKVVSQLSGDRMCMT
jgi:hypothetical protein